MHPYLQEEVENWFIALYSILIAGTSPTRRP